MTPIESQTACSSQELGTFIASTKSLADGRDASAVALTNTDREIASRLAVMRDRHRMSLRDIGKAMERSHDWVGAYLRWREADFPGNGPFAASSKAKRERRKAGGRSRLDSKRKPKAQKPGSPEWLQGHIDAFLAALAQMDPKMLAKAKRAVAEWKPAAAPSAPSTSPTSAPSPSPAPSPAPADDDGSIPDCLRRGNEVPAAESTAAMQAQLAALDVEAEPADVPVERELEPYAIGCAEGRL